MRILIDLDDTLVDMMTKSLYYYNESYRSRYGPGPEISLKQVTNWDLGEERHVFENIWRIPGFFADLPFMDSAAPDVLRALKYQGHELVIVSAPPTWESCRDKYSWVHTNLLIPGIISSMEQFVLTRGKHYIEGECMIDDKPENLEGRKYPILFDRPWNQGKSPYCRISMWDSVPIAVNHLDREPVYGYERERGA